MIPTPRRRGRALIGAVAALSVLLAACGGDDATTSGPELIYLPPTPIGGNPFLEMGWEGTQNAAAAINGTARMFESTDLNSRRANLEAAIEAAPEVIVMNTFDFTDLAAEYSPLHPEQKFILIDACPTEPSANLFCGVFREYEPSYLLGVMAGHLSEAKRVGSVGALDIPFIHRYSDSFALGAQSVDPSITDSQVFIGGESPFSDPARAKEQALSLAAQGLDHIYAVGAGSNGGIFEAATEQGFFSYGVDINECPKAPGRIVDNAMKLVDVLVETMVELILAGETESSFVSFGLDNGGMSVMALSDEVADSGCVIADYPELIEIIRGVADQIISGELVIPDPLAAG